MNRSQGRPQIPESDQRRIRRMAVVEPSKSVIARVVGCCRQTAYKYARDVEQQCIDELSEDDEEKNHRS